ncbi:MAG: hypothetical protein LBK54_01705 [Propionibacteriaceae bacterium]|jgi:hypothetical protein|nr:hypothetical protein [Propionibacteriaceae bacterium]
MSKRELSSDVVALLALTRTHDTIWRWWVVFNAQHRVTVRDGEIICADCGSGFPCLEWKRNNMMRHDINKICVTTLKSLTKRVKS